MATAQKHYTEEVVEIVRKVVRPSETSVVVTLTEDEAVTLCVILHNIGGKMSGARGEARAIVDALEDAGVHGFYKRRGTKHEFRPGLESIYFKYPES